MSRAKQLHKQRIGNVEYKEVVVLGRRDIGLPRANLEESIRRELSCRVRQPDVFLTKAVPMKREIVRLREKKLMRAVEAFFQNDYPEAPKKCAAETVAR